MPGPTLIGEPRGVKDIVRPDSVPTGIANAVRDQILNGEFAPGERITESQLSRRLKVGQPSVREALFLLEREGLVKRVANVGTFVRELDLTNISNLYQIRSALEGLAGELAAQRAPREEMERLYELGEALKTGAHKEGKEGFLQADLAFHRHLWKISGNADLAAVLEPVVVPLLTFSFMRIERKLEDLLRSAEAHLVIVDALAEGPIAARKAIEHNMHSFLERYMSSVLERLLIVQHQD